MHTDPAGVRNLHIVTNQWHMPRTKAIFNYVFALPNRADCMYGTLMELFKTLFFWNPTWPYHITYEEVGDGLEGKSLMDRLQSEEQMLVTFLNKTQHRFIDMGMMHDWIFIENEPYSTARLQYVRESPLVSLPMAT